MCQHKIYSNSRGWGWGGEIGMGGNTYVYVYILPNFREGRTAMIQNFPGDDDIALNSIRSSFINIDTKKKRGGGEVMSICKFQFS